jgi:hypothetical protein
MKEEKYLAFSEERKLSLEAVGAGSLQRSLWQTDK